MSHASRPSLRPASPSKVPVGPRDRYEPSQIEPVWRSRWRTARLFEVADPKDADQRRRKYFVAEMLPYPSGRIHMGHVRNYSIGDVLARFHRMRGAHVLHPMGWDAFGLPAENAAIERGRHPADWTRENIATMRAQLEPLGFTYDWSREITTCEPAYYRFEQLVFTKMMQSNLAYRKKAIANFCPHCETVLANEQVLDGCCWRCGREVVPRELEQWFVRITAYAQELLEGLDALVGRWPDQVLAMQRNWIGRSEGAEIRFALGAPIRVDDVSVEHVDVFTTRADTIYGASFLTLAPEHPLVRAVAATNPDVAAYVARAMKRSSRDRATDVLPKDGVPLGIDVVHPILGTRLPVWTASYVLLEYGTGAVMSVPAHDARDLAFAREHGLPIKPVVVPRDGRVVPVDEAWTQPGVMVDARDLTGKPSEEAKTIVVAELRERGLSRPVVRFRIRDWLVSRQRYWGCPIPVVYGEDGVALPVPDDQLPVVLPRDVRITGEGGSPLARHATFARARDPRDPSKPARRETDTFDTFWESSWYYLRYCSPHFERGLVAPEAADAWLPVDQYVGGIEHAVLHLLYARFFHKALIDLGFLPRSTAREPFGSLLTQGMVVMQTRFVRDEKGHPVWLYPEQVDEHGKSRVDGRTVELGRVEKMSKNKKNVVDPDAIVARFGSDTVRTFMLFAAPPDAELVWSDAGMEGANRFLARVYRVVREIAQVKSSGQGDSAEARTLRRLLHRTTHRVTRDIAERRQFNTAIAALMELVNELIPAVATVTAGAAPRGLAETVRECGATLVHLLSPFAPHLADELWATLGGQSFLLDEPWPSFDPELAREDEVEIGVQVNGRLRARIKLAIDADETTALAAAHAESSVMRELGGRAPKKVVYVPGRILSLLTA